MNKENSENKTNIKDKREISNSINMRFERRNHADST